jgi:hypothetical protein
VLTRLISHPVNQRLVDALVAPDVPFLVIGGTATQFHRAERDLDFVGQFS